MGHHQPIRRRSFALFTNSSFADPEIAVCQASTVERQLLKETGRTQPAANGNSGVLTVQSVSAEAGLRFMRV
jgi:hypothetical protein